jgi:hypothetical protein
MLCAVIAATLLLGTTGCARAITLYIFNNTDQPVVLALVMSQPGIEQPRDRWSQRKDLVVEVGQGRDSEVTYTVGGPAWRVEAQAGHCRLVYDIPNGNQIPSYPFEPEHINPYVKVQIEPDFRVHLVPESTTAVVDVTQYSAMQTGGFPLSPVDRSCGY